MKVRYFDTLDLAIKFFDHPITRNRIFDVYKGLEHTGIGMDQKGYYIQVVEHWQKITTIDEEFEASWGIKRSIGSSTYKIDKPRIRTAKDSKNSFDGDPISVIQPGMGVRNNKGAIGAVVFKNGTEYLLSCNHVFDKFQDGVTLDGNDNDRVATYQPPNIEAERLDCAVAQVNRNFITKLDPKIIGIDKVPTVSIAPSLGTEVEKFGPITGLKSGIVRLVNVIKEKDQPFKFFDVQPLNDSSPDFANNGDSGSLIVSQNDGNRALGMIVRRTEYDLSMSGRSKSKIPDGCLCISMDDIIEKLNISLTKN